MPDSVTITIPGTIDARLSPNSRGRWRSRLPLTREHRRRAYFATLDTVMLLHPDGLTPPLTLHFLVAWEKGRRIMDDDNMKASMKAIIDGIADGIGIDDKHITIGTVTQTRSGDRAGYIKVAIETREQA